MIDYIMKLLEEYYRVSILYFSEETKNKITIDFTDEEKENYNTLIKNNRVREIFNNLIPEDKVYILPEKEKDLIIKFYDEETNIKIEPYKNIQNKVINNQIVNKIEIKEG